MNIKHNKTNINNYWLFSIGLLLQIHNVDNLQLFYSVPFNF